MPTLMTSMTRPVKSSRPTGPGHAGRTTTPLLWALLCMLVLVSGLWQGWLPKLLGRLVP